MLQFIDGPVELSSSRSIQEVPGGARGRCTLNGKHSLGARDLGRGQYFHANRGSSASAICPDCTLLADPSLCGGCRPEMESRAPHDAGGAGGGHRGQRQSRGWQPST